MNFSKTQLALSAAISAALLAPALAQAQAAGLSFNLGVVSLYKSHGIDQDDRSPRNFIPALQGGVDYDFGNGFYIGNWNSTGKFQGANVEIDLYGGFAGELELLGQGLAYDLGLVRYIYPGNTAGYNSNEWYASLSWHIVSARYTRGFGDDNRAARFSLALEQPLTAALTLNAGLGFRNSVNYDGADDYHIGLRYDLGNDLSASGTLSGAQTSKVGDAGKARLVLGIGKSF